MWISLDKFFKIDIIAYRFCKASLGSGLASHLNRLAYARSAEEADYAVSDKQKFKFHCG